MTFQNGCHPKHTMHLIVISLTKLYISMEFSAQFNRKWIKWNIVNKCSFKFFNLSLFSVKIFLCPRTFMSLGYILYAYYRKFKRFHCTFKLWYDARDVEFT